MKSKWTVAGIVSLGLALALGTSALAATGEHKSVGRLMRESGFKHKTASWTSVTTRKEEGGKTTTTEGKMWISGDKYRLETKDSGGKATVIIDDGKEMYMYTPSENKAVKWGAGAEAMFGNILSSDLVAESIRQRKTAKKTGSEKVDGKPCDIYVYPSKISMMNNVVTSEVKEWLWTAEKFPLKSVVNTPKYQMKIMFITQDMPASETTNVVKDLALDQPVDDKLFALPAGTKIETLEVPPMMGGGGVPVDARPQTSGGNGRPAQAGEGANKGENSGGGGSEQQQPPVDVNKLLKGLF